MGEQRGRQREASKSRFKTRGRRARPCYVGAAARRGFRDLGPSCTQRVQVLQAARDVISLARTDGQSLGVCLDGLRDGGGINRLARGGGELGVARGAELEPDGRYGVEVHSVLIGGDCVRDLTTGEVERPDLRNPRVERCGASRDDGGGGWGG